MSVTRRINRVTSLAGRRRALRLLAALAAAGSPLARGKTAASFTAESRLPGERGRRMTELIGSNGWAGAASDVQMWRAMGISWGRDSVGPGQRDGPQDVMRIDKTSSAFDSDLPPALIANDRNGIGSLLQLGYTPTWNASVPGDGNSAPVDVEVWERYVEAVVRTYSAPPYNLRYFQIWNEAAGRLSGGLAQATFWHGADAAGNVKSAKPYERAMQDYVERIHIPAARIIRRYHAYVVYGGWPDQGGLDNFRTWLEYRSPVLKERMLDWVDYIDTHYLPVADLDSLYQQYVRNGPARGIWQTEIGDAYMKDPHYLPRYFFDFAVWALDRNWDHANKYLSMIYHWDGYEPFRLTHRGPPRRTYNVSGRSLVILNKAANGSLASFSKPLQFDPGVSGSALLSGHDVVMQVSGAPGWQSVAVGELRPSSSRNAQVEFIDALSGTASARDDVALAWSDQTLKIRFKVPDRVNGADNKPPRHLAYVVVRGVA
ncbi:hypothetical protein PQR67_27505 [Paraburkholderia fungorum]|uniref:hypothetical protein n=1 Tax=Paraburkholderia fungorum TaxID=134537 RepID=UPI0038B6F7EC